MKTILELIELNFYLTTDTIMNVHPINPRAEETQLIGPNIG